MNAKNATKTPAKGAPSKPVTREDIQAKFRELQGEVDDRVEKVKVPAAAIAAGVAVAAVFFAYWAGRRRGKKRQLILEVKRI
jgi:hypothetical protein